MALFLPLDRWCWELWVYFPILQLQPLGDLCNTKRQRYLSCNERFRKKLLKILHTDLKIKLPSKNIIQSFHAWLEKSQNLCPKVCRGETSRNLCCPRTEEHNRLLGFFYTKWQIEFLPFSYLKGNNCFITYIPNLLLQFDEIILCLVTSLWIKPAFTKLKPSFYFFLSLIQ